PISLSAQTVSEAEVREFQRIITGQLDAFNADDGAGAYEFAAPSIRRMFPTPEIFLSMVKKGYPPIYRRQSYSFGRIGNEFGGAPTQHVTIIDANGKAWTALYAMERQPDGSWKIVGCRLVEAPGVSA
ncbi:MAG: DUF4864 domain-containing protein, partial [Parvibaculaceae bacterium]